MHLTWDGDIKVNGDCVAGVCGLRPQLMILTAVPDWLVVGWELAIYQTRR